MTAQPAVLDFDATLSLLNRAVEEKGADYIYEQLPGSPYCVYRNEDGSPSCLAGHVFDYLGVLGAVQENASAASQPPEIIGLFDDPAMMLIERSQDAQDDGRATWRDSVDFAVSDAVSLDAWFEQRLAQLEGDE